MRKTLIAALVVLSAAAGTTAPALAGSRPRLAVVGLTDGQRLVLFQASSPEKVHDLGAVRGLQGDSALVGIDYRVQNGRLYGVGDQGGVYVLNRSAVATKVSQLTVALSGTGFGVDFNPAANRLRVISDTGQNLRHNIDDPAGTPAAGQTVADGPLTNPPVPPATTGATALGVSGAAYTNNDLSPATATTLFDLDTGADRVSLQSPANAGTLAPVGALGVAATGGAGFDVYSSVRGEVTVSNSAFATLRVGDGYRFYGVDLLTGAADLYGSFPRHRQVVDIALPLDRN
ncbi:MULTISPECIES: DUF4394 domain-containing protein [Streptosporangium]|uniref:DUF4394 domain-containing protein n=1 Tax=Streptosporangium brasiliense TaxID=47480 RepID=A0ABT9RGN7_9ACTN|nr:DUF4394 domain-containing protein [Streptosporangium brasiliense]MDP9868410.1 hypothetical protein [Streptosporangium brasiliense]